MNIRSVNKMNKLNVSEYIIVKGRDKVYILDRHNFKEVEDGIFDFLMSDIPATILKDVIDRLNNTVVM